MADSNALKLKRRGAKTRFTKFGQEVKTIMDMERPRKQLEAAFNKYEQAYTD